MEMISEKGIV